MDILINLLMILILFCLVVALIENIKIKLSEPIKKLEGRVLSKRVQSNCLESNYFISFIRK